MASFFDEIARNRLKSLLLLFIFGTFFAVLIYILVYAFGGGPFAFSLGMAAVVIYAILIYYTGDKVVLAISRAKEADSDKYQTLYSTVEGLASATQVKMPKVYIIDDPNPNAFATGRRGRASVAVTTGLLSMMNRSELEGVLAHEMSHVADNDVLVMTVAIAFAGVIGLVAAFIRGLFFFGGFGRGRGGILMIIALVIGLLAPLFALLIRLAISRRREYMADANGARLIRDPGALANALKKIQAYTSAPDAQKIIHANEVTGSLYFSSPFTGRSLMNLFSTHPPIEERIARLEKMY
ncbi:MAG: M48 family metalloprotease [Candidatus Micrarchaeota archaeon]|nr:M48 family metalloprotease [Candidatus Micrarchaeota archaeon]MDE1847814.1 M48 family metalloprotease [Candidatus Micrarchaeota archaeon]MDE1864380.1 M48 family metalloprotease [Candidatus Micrarchaeota archaeon]